MVGNQICLALLLRLRPGYVHVKFDFNLNSFAISFGRSAEGHVKMTAPSRVSDKTKPKKWIKYFKLCNFIAVLSSRNVVEGFRIKLFIYTLGLDGQIVT